MNELRMYVERLFEGRVLTAEMIELKEEIYGNLVARYEDYLAEGMDASEALEKTKASMTSIDDVLDAEEDAAGKAASGKDDAPAEQAEGSVDESEQGPEAGDGCVPAPGPAAEADRVAADETSAALTMPIAPGAPVPPVQASQDGSDPSAPAAAPASAARRKWPIVAAAVAAIVIVPALAIALMSGLGFVAFDGGEPDIDLDESRTQVDAGDAPASANAPSGNGQANGAGREIVVSLDGTATIDGEPGDELLLAVVNSTYGGVAPYVETDLDDAAAVEALVRALPMGANACDIDTTQGVDTLSLAYRELPEAYDGDSVDAALAYDVTALLCAMPTVNEVRVTTTESDEPTDESYYVFKRDDVQRCYGVRLDGDLVNEAGWAQIKDDGLYRKHFIERMVETAESAWR